MYGAELTLVGNRVDFLLNHVAIEYRFTTVYKQQNSYLVLKYIVSLSITLITDQIDTIIVQHESVE